MSYPTTDQPKSLPIENSSKAGTFEKLLIKQLSKIVVGHLHIHTAQNSYHLGKGGENSLVATLQVENPIFFRKAVLGGSLGVADSYSDGDWSTPDMVKLFRLFLQNQDVMDSMEGGLATILNKLAMWSYQVSQKRVAGKTSLCITIWEMISTN